ncbi:hypothetical protein BJY52DRAFT_1150034 [Lactarius psammicola]|nr:hypothetical protein BJY52DRAFT_1150034 [Lactarius psammicola]
MAPPNANMGDDDDETQTLNASFEQQTKAQGEIYGGSSGRPWSIYLTETEKQDKEMIERWKGEADTALIFAGLFTAVVTVSLVESYKWLSPDRGDENIKLLAQISGQLANISSLVSNGIPLESITVESRQPFKPTASTVLVNLAWFGSLVLCLACSVGATLIQLCARRYLALTQGRGAPYERAHLRTFMFDGVRRFEVDRILQVVPILLQLSVLLYCLGLLIFLFSIGPRIGFAALVILIIFNLIYAIFTVLPIFSLNSPYATPYSPLTWRLFHVFLLGVFSTIRGIVNLFHGPLSTLWSRTYRPVGGPHEPAQWRKMLERRVKTHRRKFSDGIWKSIEHRATDASQMVDANTLEWTLTARVENSSDKEIEDFAAWVPEFFDTYARSAASEAVHPLMSDKPPTHPIFGFRLHHLLKTCCAR